MKYIFFVCALPILIAASCKKTPTDQDELSKLPPATQTGANTFGCLVNGKAWVAQTDCKFLCDPAFKVNYDSWGGGSLSLDAKKENNATNTQQSIVISFDSTNFKSVYVYKNNPIDMAFAYKDYVNRNDCTDLSSRDITRINTTGTVTLTHYNLQTGIISGTFEFSLVKAGCETITVTNGRFDKKL